MDLFRWAQDKTSTLFGGKTNSNMAETRTETPDTTKSDSQKSGEKERKGDPKLLDLAFGMDCTGSMGSYIDSARQNIRTIVEEIVAAEKADVRLALVEYRDHPPQESTFVTRVHDFTPSVRTMRGWLDACSADGGGDTPEAVADALHQVLKLSWRDEATKICVFISDAPPHGLSEGAGDSFPNGCPDGLDPMEVTNHLAEKGVSLYTVGCEPSISPYKEFFMALAHLTGGQYVPLGHAKLLSKVIVGGAQEEMSLQQLMEEVNEEVQAAVREAGDADVSHDRLSEMVHEKMQVKGKQAKKLRCNAAELPEATAQAQMYSGFSSMSEVRTSFKPVESSDRGGRGGGIVSCPMPRAMRAPPSPMAPGFCPPPTEGGCCPPPPPPMGGVCAPTRRGASFSAAPMADDMFSDSAVSSDMDVYDAVEESVSVQQVSRMVKKSVMQNQLQSKVKK